MSKQANLPFLTAAAAIAGVLAIAAPALAHARSHASESTATKMHAAKTHAKRHYQAIAHKEIRDVAPGAPPDFQAWNPPGCTWPYTRMAPPCMSTWPPDDPNFHGYNR